MFGTPMVAKRVHKKLSRFFTFHAARDDTFTSPLAAGMASAIGLPTIKDMTRDRAL